MSAEINTRFKNFSCSFMIWWILINAISIGSSLGFLTTERSIKGTVDFVILLLASGFLIARLQSRALLNFPVSNWGWNSFVGWVIGLGVGTLGGGWWLWIILGVSLGIAQGFSIKHPRWPERWVLISAISFLIVIFIGGFVAGIIGYFTGGIHNFIAMFVAGSLYGIITSIFLEWIRLEVHKV